MLKNEGFYTAEDIKGLRVLTSDEVEKPGDYWALGDNGRSYRASYTDKYMETLGGVFFFAIPAEVKIIGYIPMNE